MHKDQYQFHVSVADMTAKPGGDEHNEDEAQLTLSPSNNNEQHPNIVIVLTESQCSMRIACK